jgi:Lrp/AsnC family transcriptional regulator
VNVLQHDPKYIREFAERMKVMPEVLECYVLLGAFDFLIRVVTPDLQSYETFYFKKLSCIPGVREASTFVSISEVKMTTALPLD